MASTAQVIANIANSTKFGFYSKQAVLLTDEDHLAFQALTESYQSELHPKTGVQETFFGQIILAVWNLQRANCLEAKLALSEGVDPLLSTSKTIDRIQTFRNRTERNYFKLLNEFRLLQNEPKLPKPAPAKRTQMSWAAVPLDCRSTPSSASSEPQSHTFNHFLP